MSDRLCGAALVGLVLATVFWWAPQGALAGPGPISPADVGVPTDGRGYRLFATSANLGVVEIAPPNGSVLNAFDAPLKQGVADGLAFDGATLYYLSGSWDSNTLYALDPASGEVRSAYVLPPNAFRNGLACLNGLVYILEWSVLDQDILVFDPRAGTVVDTLDVGAANPGAPLISGGLAAITRPDALLVTTALTNELLELDPATGKIRGRFTHGRAGTLGVATAYDLIFLGANTSASLQVYSRDGELRGAVEIPDSIGVQSLGGDNISAGHSQVFLPIVAK